MTRSPTTTSVAAERAEAFFASLGRHVAWVEDAPGLVLGRIVCQLVNEACFAVTEGVGTPEDIDDGMKLGLNYPRGPFGWLEAIGPHHVLAVLDALRRRARRGALPRGADAAPAGDRGGVTGRQSHESPPRTVCSP